MNPPKPLSRREVLQTAAALGVTAVTLGAGDSEAGEAAARASLPFAEKSGLVTGQLKPLKYQEIPGLLTKEQIAPHYNAHYGGALRNYLSDEQQLDTMLKSAQPPGGPAYSFLQKDKLNRMNSVILHELYFDNLAPAPPAPKEDIRVAIAARFGTLERWVDDFKACCMAANGWGILARDPVNGKLYNVASDLHEVGVIWFGQPLIVCDVYEHAFYVDYQNRKQEYVNRFVQFMDWAEINMRFQVLAK